MKALTLTPPWDTPVVLGQKPIENRTWHLPKTVRGTRVLIHAAKGMRRDDYAWAARFCADLGVAVPAIADVRRGGIVGAVTIVDCLCPGSSTFLDHRGLDHRWWMDGQHGFVLRDPQAIPFIPCSGALGFWEVPQDVLELLPEDVRRG